MIRSKALSYMQEPYLSHSGLASSHLILLILIVISHRAELSAVRVIATYLQVTQPVLTLGLLALLRFFASSIYTQA